jgi:hypothetical protein
MSARIAARAVRHIHFRSYRAEFCAAENIGNASSKAEAQRCGLQRVRFRLPPSGLRVPALTPAVTGTKSLGMRTYEILDLKSFRMRTYKNMGRGAGTCRRGNFAVRGLREAAPSFGHPT